MELVNITNAITIKNGVASVSHIFIAEKTNNDKTSIKKLIEKHKNDFEKFGNVNFEFETIKAGRGTTRRKVYHLNEYQAYLLLTFLQNTKEVKNFKVWLISEFKKLRENKQPQPNLFGELDDRAITELIKRTDIVRGYQETIKRLENELAKKQSEIKNLELKTKVIAEGAKDYIVEKIEKAQKELDNVKALFTKPVREDKNFIYVGNAILPKNGRF